MKTLKNLTLMLCALSMLSGCATFQSDNAGDEFQAIDQPETKSRKKKTLLTIGGILLVGAIVAHEAQDGANDALREAARP